MNSANHVSDEDLALYALGETGAIDGPRIEAHLNGCEDCRMVVVMQRELRDVEALGLFPHPEEVLTLRALRANRGKKAPEEPKPGWKHLFGIVGILGGVAGLEQLPHHGAPAFGSRSTDPTADPSHHAEPGRPESQPHEYFSEDTVRNLHHPSSEVLEKADSVHSQSDSTHEDGRTDMSSVHTVNSFEDAHKAFGTPGSHDTSEYVHQHYSDTCAVQCQHVILNQFGVEVSEDQLVKEASARGIYTPGHGTSPQDVGKLLEAHGIPVHREVNANVFNLAIELSQGHKVIVGLESGELWHTNTVLESIASSLGIGQADHAVIVSGIDTSHPGHETVIITDPGTGDVAKEYPLGEFLDAWKGSHFTMVSTTLPAPAFNPEMVNFDYHTGHIESVGGAPYDLVHEMEQQASHETDPGVLQNLENIFAHLMDGGISIGDIMGALVHDDPAHHSIQDLASHLLSLAHGAMATGAISAILDSVTDIGALHTAAADFHRSTHASHHDTSHEHHESAFGRGDHHDLDTFDTDEDS